MNDTSTQIDAQGLWNISNAIPNTTHIKNLKCNLTVGEFVKVSSVGVFSPCYVGLIAIIYHNNNVGIVLMPLLTTDVAQRNNIGLIVNNVASCFPEVCLSKYFRVVNPESTREIDFVFRLDETITNRCNPNQSMRNVNMLRYR